MPHQQFPQSNIALHRLTKFALLLAEAAIVTTGITVFATTNKAYASDVSVRFTPIPSLQEVLQTSGALGSAKDLGTVEIPASDPRRPCYVGEQAGCIIGDSFIDPQHFRQISGSINSTRLHPFDFDTAPAQVNLFEVSF